MATKYDNLHIKVSKSDLKIIDDVKTLQFVGTANGENIVELREKFAVKVMNSIDDEIINKVIEEAKAAGINDVYLMNRNFIRNTIRDAIGANVKPESIDIENDYLSARVYVLNDHINTLKAKINIQNDEIKNLKAELAKARGGCQKLRESKEELQECVQTLKKNFNEEREARIRRDKEYTTLFKKHEILKKNSRTLGYRLCRVNGRNALFHGWFSEQSLYRLNGNPVMTTFGLVEFENGSLNKTPIGEIRFCDDECLAQWEGKE